MPTHKDLDVLKKSMIPATHVHSLTSQFPITHHTSPVTLSL
jgi:hypothetical protein